MKKNLSLGIGALGATALILTGCSGSGDDADALTVWIPTQEGSQSDAIASLEEGFEAAHEGVDVEFEERSIDQHKEAMRQTAGTNSGPDVYWYWEGAGLGGELVDVGVSLDLTDYYAEYGWEDRFTPASLAGITQYGGFHGVPWTLQGEGIYYNKALFAEAGIDEAPTTYDELVSAADALVGAGITPIEFGGTVNWHVMRLLDALVETECGADTADALNTGDGDWAAESCVTAAFTELKTWGDTYLNEGFMGISNDDSSQLFYSGDAAMAFEGTWFNANAVDNGMDPENIGIIPFPTGTDRLYGFGEGYFINAATENPDLAAELLDYMTSLEGQEIAGSAWGAIPVNAEAPVDESNPLNVVWADIFATADAGMYANNDQNLTTAETTEYWRIQNSVLTGDLDPADAGAEFQAFREANS
ncbi:ABC transporter substrate-binding protein [Microbacterium excoecariae]|uniref:ABC transporter substrate-binding protein n=1 Tax=Microbacterium excoecariae TaxID=2715210 RepID=UPI001409C644|nr:extracellular solute-binding protein [Microbacterium excoecariae]NHI15760.1 extracellular solute-binding protein [Microbacterium excoecariae]